MDRDILRLFDELERAVYGHESDKESREIGGNFSVSLVPWPKQRAEIWILSIFENFLCWVWLSAPTEPQLHEI
jgi:hypothetical protein